MLIFEDRQKFKESRHKIKSPVSTLHKKQVN